MLVIFCACAKLSWNRRHRQPSSQQREEKESRLMANRPNDILLTHDRRGIATAGVYARTHDTVHHLIDGLPTRAHKLVRRGGLDERAAITAARARGIDRKRFERREARRRTGSCIAAPVALYDGRRRGRSAREQTREARAGGRAREERRRTTFR